MAPDPPLGARARTCTHGEVRVQLGKVSPLTWVLGIKHDSLGFHSKHLYPLGHLIGSLFSKSYLHSRQGWGKTPSLKTAKAKAKV